MSADPTLESLALLDDPTRFRLVPNVPIFKPHVRKDKDGTELYEIKDSHIPEIAKRMQEREKGGVVGRLTLGHVKPGQAQREQPPLVGYWRKPREGIFGPKSEPCVLVDYAVKIEDWEEFKNSPYRSAEFYPGKGIITGVACLKTDPELDLGVLIFENGERCYHYSMESAHEGTEEVSPEQMRIYAACTKKMFPYMDRVHKEHAERYEAAGPGIPSSTNVMVPKMDKKEPQTLEQLQAQMVTYEAERAADKKKVDDLIALNTAQQDRIHQLEHTNQLTMYERDLEMLHRDLVFDLAEEKTLVAEYTPEQFANHKKIMQRYEKRPHAVSTVSAGSIVRNTVSKPRKATIAEHHEAIAIAQREGIGYGEALAEVMNPAATTAQ